MCRYCSITGDLIDSNKSDIDYVIKVIKEINKLAKIYYVTGNHEGDFKKYSMLREKLIDSDVYVLENVSINIDKNITISGIMDPWFNIKNNDKDTIKKNLKKIVFDKNRFNILLSHRPEHFNEYAKENIDVVFCGHAHGGQVRLPFIGGLYAPHQGILPKYTSGTFYKNGTTMVVSRGIGNSTFPFRINNRPELVILEIDRK